MRCDAFGNSDISLSKSTFQFLLNVNHAPFFPTAHKSRCLISWSYDLWEQWRLFKFKLIFFFLLYQFRTMGLHETCCWEQIVENFLNFSKLTGGEDENRGERKVSYVNSRTTQSHVAFVFWNVTIVVFILPPPPFFCN